MKRSKKIKLLTNEKCIIIILIYTILCQLLFLLIYYKIHEKKKKMLEVWYFLMICLIKIRVLCPALFVWYIL